MNKIGDSTILITTREDLTDIVNNAVRVAITPFIQLKKEEPERFNINGAAEYLQTIGVPISKSALYKLTSIGSVPVYRFSGRLVFVRQELEAWATSKLKSPQNNKIEYAVADSICRKKQTVKI